MKLRVATLICFVALFLLWLAAPLAASIKASGEPQRTRRARPSQNRVAPARSRRDYTNFDHATEQHRKACDSCHKFPSANWKTARQVEPFPDITEYPDHSSCLDCHRQQFFARERPRPQICSVCHVGVTPRNTVRWPFPTRADAYDASLKGRTAVSDFGVSFPHEKHEGLFEASLRDERAGWRYVRASFKTTARGAARQDETAKQNAACATCHQTVTPQGDSDDEYLTPPPKGLAEGAFWLKKGTFKSSPRDHSLCFTCHSTEGGIAPAQSDCATCHKLLPPSQRLNLVSPHDDFDPKLATAMGITERATLRRWAGREAGRFRHEWPPHDLACTACHKTPQMNAAAPGERRVAVMSCGGEGTGCHIEPTADGLLNTSVAQRTTNPAFECATCHVRNGRLPIPASHTSALPSAKK